MKHYLDGQFQYGLKDGKLVHVSEVANGRKCNCICPNCRQHLIAHNNPSERKAIHFQHENTNACKGYYETVLHYMAKEIIQESGYLDVPDVEYQLPESALEYQFGVTTFSREVINMKRLKFDSVELEMTEGAFRPDVKATINGKSFYIEVAVSHKVDDIKLAKIREAGIAVLEIDLSKERREITKADLASMLNRGNVKMKWIHNPKIMKRLSEREEEGSKSPNSYEQTKSY